VQPEHGQMDVLNCLHAIITFNKMLWMVFLIIDVGCGISSVYLSLLLNFVSEQLYVYIQNS